jgi:hypothetical protein
MIKHDCSNNHDAEADRDADPASGNAAEKRLGARTRCCEGDKRVSKNTNRFGKIPSLHDSIVTSGGFTTAALPATVTRMRYEVAIVVACDSKLQRPDGRA